MPSVLSTYTKVELKKKLKRQKIQQMQPNKIQFLLNRLYQLNPPDRIELTLDRIQRLLKDLKHPEQQLSNVITVTGTKRPVW